MRVELKQGESVTINDLAIQLNGFNRQPSHKNYTSEEGDIALGAKINITGADGESFDQQPIFIIRQNQQFSIKEYTPELGLHIRFSKVDPATETMTFTIAQDDRADMRLETLIADDVPRSDILVLQANVFPGINLVWLGCLMMLFGLLLSLLVKKRARRVALNEDES